MANLPAALANQLPDDVEGDTVRAFLSVRGGLSEGHVLWTGERLLALLKTSALGPLDVVELDPTSPPAMARAKWEDVIRLEGVDGAAHDLPLPTIGRDRVLEGLDGLYRALEAWGPLRASLQARLEGTRDRGKRAALVREVAALDEEGGDFEAAAGAYAALLAENLRDAEARAGLARCFAAGAGRAHGERLASAHADAGDWAAAAEVQRALYADDAPEALRERALRVAEICVDHLADGEGAMRALAVALGVRFDDLSLDCVLRWVQRTGATELGADLLVEVAHAQDAPTNDLLHTAACLSLGERPQHAERLWRQALDDDDAGAHLPSLMGLAELCRAQGRWHEFVELAEQAAPRIGTLRDREEWLRRVAHAYEQHLEDPDAALRSWEALSKLSPLDPEALGRLEALYAERERWPELFALLERRLAGSTDDAERLGLLARLAELAETRLDDPEKALRLWQQVRERDPEHVQALQRIDALLVAAERWPDVERLLAERIEAAPPGTSVELARRLARLYADHFDNAEKALETWKDEVIEFAPDDLEALGAVVALHAARGEHHGHVDALGRLLAALPEDAPQRIEHAETLARVLQVELGNLEDAFAAWGALLEADPTHLDALDAQLDLAFELDRPKEALKLLERRRAWAEDDDLPLTRRAAALKERFGAHDEAIEEWRAVLVAAPEDEEALDRLEALYERRQRWRDLFELHRRRLASDDDPARAEAAAGLAERRLGDTRAAFELLLPTLIGPDRERVDQIARLAAASGQGEALLASLAARGSDWSPTTLQAARALHRHAPRDVELARVVAERLSTEGEVGEAMKVLEAAVVVAPGDVTLWQQGAALLERDRRWPSLADWLRHMFRCEALPRGARQRAAERRATLYAEALDSPGEAAAARADAASLQPSRAPALVLAAALVLLGVATALWLSFYGG